MNNITNILSSAKNITKFSFPIICNSLINIIPTLASMWILAKLGKDQLAAAGIAAPTFFTILTICVTGFFAVGIKISYSIGENKKNIKTQNHKQVGHWVINGIILALIIAIPAVIILLSAPSFLLLIGQKQYLVNLSKTYFYYGALAIIPMLINASLSQYFISTGHPKIIFFISLITLPLIIALSYALILGKWGFPQLAMGGINLASFIIDILITIIGVFIIIFATWSKKNQVFVRPFGVSYKKCIELFQLGWPISIQVGGELASLTVIAYMIGKFGPPALAAAQILQQFVLIFVMINIGLSQGVSVLISRALGEKRLDEVKITTISGTIIIVSIAIIFSILFFVFPANLVDFYLNIKHSEHNQVEYFAIYFMKIAALYIIFDGIRGVLTASLRGLQDSKIPMRVGIFCLWLIGIPCAYLAGFVLNGGPIALRFGFVAGVASAMVIMIVRYKIKVNTIKT